MEETVSSIMNPKVVSIRMEDTLRTIKGIFDRQKFHHLLVLSNKKIKGVISDRDYLKAISGKLGTAQESLEDQKSLDKTAMEIMSRQVIAVKPDLKLESAAQLMLAKNISCLPVADKYFHAVGIVTLKEILRFYIKMDQVNEAHLTRFVHREAED